MKKVTITGGLLGFGIGLFAGLATEGSAWPGILWRASVSALLCSLLLRWWWRFFARCVAQARTQRLAALAAAAAKEPPVSPFTGNRL